MERQCCRQLTDQLLCPRAPLGIALHQPPTALKSLILNINTAVDFASTNLI